MRFKGLGFAVFAVGVTACLSPTLPLPPPEVPTEIAQLPSGAWGIQGTCIPGAEVTVLDTATGRGVVVVDEGNIGSYRVELDGAPCDFVQVHQSQGTEVSADTGFLLEPVSPSSPNQPSMCTN